MLPGPKTRRFRAVSLGFVVALVLLVYFRVDTFNFPELEPGHVRPLESVKETVSSRCASWRPDQFGDDGSDDDPEDCLRARQYRQVEKSLRREEGNR